MIFSRGEGFPLDHQSMIGGGYFITLQRGECWPRDFVLRASLRQRFTLEMSSQSLCTAREAERGRLRGDLLDERRPQTFHAGVAIQFSS